MTSLEHDWFPRPLPANVVLGERSWLYSSFAFLHCRSRQSPAVAIGPDSGVYNGSFFELGEQGSVEIGAYCAVVGAIFACDCRVVVEDYAFIAHEVVISDSRFAVPSKAEAGTEPKRGSSVIRVGRNSWIGARAVLLAGADIGEGAIVGAGSVVDFAVPSFAIVAGNPARIVGSAVPRSKD
jgi:acetyltransferase-like isoleucine patch superfamily enzyme